MQSSILDFFLFVDSLHVWLRGNRKNHAVLQQSVLLKWHTDHIMKRKCCFMQIILFRLTIFFKGTAWVNNIKLKWVVREIIHEKTNIYTNKTTSSWLQCGIIMLIKKHRSKKIVRSIFQRSFWYGGWELIFGDQQLICSNTTNKLAKHQLI